MFFVVIKSCWALLFGIALMMLGNGLQGTLLGLRANQEGFSISQIGLMMTTYFVGFLFGSIVVPKRVNKVGHVRVFAALASLASCAVLLHSVFLTPWSWILFRLFSGFSYAGLYVVAESWLNQAATNETRGRLLSIYMIIVLGCSGIGQFLLNLAPPSGVELFILVSVLVSAALIPITLSVSRAPELNSPDPASIKMLFQASPLGVIGAFAIGIAHSTMVGMGAIYGDEIGLSESQIALLMASWFLGGLLLQWPIGRLSDVLERRRVILFVTLAAGAAASAAVIFGELSYVALIVCSACLGGTSLPLYALCIAHTNDHLAPKQIIAASGTLVLVGGFGLSMGPLLASQVMGLFGPSSLFGVIASVHTGLGLYAIYRMARRDPVPLTQQRVYQQVVLRTSPVAQQVAMRNIRDTQDRDLAKMTIR